MGNACRRMSLVRQLSPAPGSGKLFTDAGAPHSISTSRVPSLWSVMVTRKKDNFFFIEAHPLLARIWKHGWPTIHAFPLSQTETRYRVRSNIECVSACDTQADFCQSVVRAIRACQRPVLMIVTERVRFEPTDRVFPAKVRPDQTIINRPQ